jgi:cardiolipin synthase A/B
MSEISHQSMSTLKKIFYPRTFILMVSLIGQFTIIVAVILRFSDYFAVFYGASLLLSLVAFLWVVNSKINPSYKIAWIIPIMLFPIFGGLFYVFFGRSKMSRKTAAKMKAYEKKVHKALEPYKISAEQNYMGKLTSENRTLRIKSSTSRILRGTRHIPTVLLNTWQSVK